MIKKHVVVDMVSLAGCIFISFMLFNEEVLVHIAFGVAIFLGLSKATASTRTPTTNIHKRGS